MEWCGRSWSSQVDIVLPFISMIHLLILAVHLLGTIAKLVRPGGVRAELNPCSWLSVIARGTRRRIRSIASFLVLDPCSFWQAGSLLSTTIRYFGSIVGSPT
jgi:hypothetical protein